jgi:outer membrane protein OmpA-like peptidoglycan-associated protein
MDQNRRATGAVIGGAAGTAAGAILDEDNRWRGALIGAVAGAALGTGVGHVLQKQKEAFDRIEGLETQQQTVILQQPPVSYGTGEPAPPQSTRAAALNLRMSSEVLFDRGSSALSPMGTGKIAEVAQVLRQHPGSDVYIRGYTSSEGDDRSNFELSQRRAEIVRNELIAQGIGPAGVFAQGMGSSNPVASNATEAGRVQNRRVELIIVPRATG